MTRRHGWAVVALLCAVVPTAGCAAEAGERPRATASVSASPSVSSCRSGRIHWVMTQRERRLTEVSPVVKVRKGDRREIEYPVVHVRTVGARVDTVADGPTDRRVVASLAGHLHLAPGMLARPGQTSKGRPRDKIKTGTLGEPGRFVQANGVTVVNASFTVTCPGRDEDVYGSVTTWSGDSTAFLQCGVSPGKEPWVEEAYRLTCGPLPLSP